MGLVDMSVIWRLADANPVAVASGTFGYGREYQPYMDISKIGQL